MNVPWDHFPVVIPEDAINALLITSRFPQATAITHSKVTAQYHPIYIITLTPAQNSRGHDELVVHVSGRHLPETKTK
ncbi:Fc.00g106320.m01.CDS01 [Cosmosporella sp. VM-42]